MNSSPRCFVLPSFGLRKRDRCLGPLGLFWEAKPGKDVTQIYYPPVIKHGWLDNPLIFHDFPSESFHFRGVSQPCLIPNCSANLLALIWMAGNTVEEKDLGRCGSTDP